MKSRVQRSFSRERVLLILLAVTLVGAFLFSNSNGSRAPRLSSETRFLERTANGMLIMPASCPSDPHYDGDCTPWISFVASGSGATALSGHLQAKPLIVAKGGTVHLYWNVKDATSCTVKGTNGDLWTQLSAGNTGVVSKPVLNQTVYTLQCQALDLAVPPEGSGLAAGTTNITERIVVNVIPKFQEK